MNGLSSNPITWRWSVIHQETTDHIIDDAINDVNGAVIEEAKATIETYRAM